MKVIFLARSGVQSSFISQRLIDEKLVDAVLFESGTPAKIRKLKRIFSQATWRHWPDRIRDIIALLRLDAECEAYYKKHLDIRPKPLSVPTFRCGDANDRKTRKILIEQKPDLVLVYGTAILRKRTLDLAPLFLNIHSGLVPKYRNVHSEFWAFLNGAPHEIGTSILKMNEKIDAGPVVASRPIGTEVDSFFEGLTENLQLASSLAAQAIRDWRSGKLEMKEQDSSQAFSFQTPTWRDIQALKKTFVKRPCSTLSRR